MTRYLPLGLLLLSMGCRGQDAPPRVLTADDGPAVVVAAGETRTLRDQVIQAGPEGPAVVVEGVLEASHLEVEGGDPAFLVRSGGRLVLSDSRLEQGVAGVRVLGGEARLQGVTIDRPQEEALLVSGGALTLEQVHTAGGEYGLLARDDARLEVRGLIVEGPRYAGVGMSTSQGRLDELRLVGGAHGGLLANDLSGPLRIDGLEIREVSGVGLQLLRGTLDLTRARIARVDLDPSGGGGNALLLDDAEATLADVSAVSVAGSAVLAFGGRISVAGLMAVGCGGAAIQGRREARLSLAGVAVERCAGPGLLAVEGSRLSAAQGVAPDLSVRCEEAGIIELPPRLVLRGSPDCVHPLQPPATAEGEGR